MALFWLSGLRMERYNLKRRVFQEFLAVLEVQRNAHIVFTLFLA
jgi:hypothetical protein